MTLEAYKQWLIQRAEYELLELLEDFFLPIV